MTTLTANGQTPNHHGSHRHLVHIISEPEVAKLDAIIMPTGRPVAYLKSAIRMAAYHNCTLVLLCSMRSSALAALRLPEARGVEIIAVDTDAVLLNLLPKFQTTTLLRGTRFDRRTDTSHKRNLGLLLAKMVGWERIVFLDDDIEIPNPDALAGAVGSLGRFASVGLTIAGFPDNSVVCHAYRMAGGEQDTFIGGGALAVGVDAFDSFFPNIYNEDWFFLLGDNGLRPSALTNGVVTQAPYDPFRNTMRARSEELGDSLAEGLFRLLDASKPLMDANFSYWAGFLTKRRKFIDEIIDMVGDALPGGLENNRMIDALKAAIGRNLVIDPQLCVDYVDAWRIDRGVWRDQIRTVWSKLGVQKALSELGLMHGYQPGV